MKIHIIIDPENPDEVFKAIKSLIKLLPEYANVLKDLSDKSPDPFPKED